MTERHEVLTDAGQGEVETHIQPGLLKQAVTATQVKAVEEHG